MSYFEKLIVSAIDCTFDLTFPIKRVNTFFSNIYPRFTFLMISLKVEGIRVKFIELDS